MAMSKAHQIRIGAGLALGLALCGCAADDTAGQRMATGGIGAGSGGQQGGGIFDNTAPKNSDGGTGGQLDLPSLCPMGEAWATRVKSRVALVVDGSKSMTDFDFRDTGMPRWDVLQSALTDPDEGVVARFGPAADFGVRVYQSTADTGGLNPGQCPYPDGSVVEPASDNVGAIANTLATNRPERDVGTTPTAAGLRAAYDAFGDVNPDGDEGPRVVILATDGEPNGCVNEFDVEVSFLADCPSADQVRSCTAGGTCVCFVPAFADTLDAVQYGRNRDVWTYVVSLADADGAFATHLQQLANAGAGLPIDAADGAQLYVPTNPVQLRQQLLDLVGGSVSCDVTLNGVVDLDRAGEGIVTLDGQELAYEDPDGWVLVDEGTIRAQGQACTAFRQSPLSKLEATFPCEVFTVQ